MATEILRPTATKDGVPADILLHPDTTQATDAHRLLNEDAADDDATYIEFTKVLQYIYFHFASEKLLTDYSKIKYCRGTVRGKTSSLKLPITVQVEYIDASSRTSNIIEPTSTDWTSYSFDIDVSRFISVMEECVSSNKEPLIMLSCSSSSDDKNTMSLCITQVYIEVTYDDGTTETTDTIYLKEDGSWTSISGTIYKKQDGAWAVADSTVFENGDKFIVQKLT